MKSFNCIIDIFSWLMLLIIIILSCSGSQNVALILSTLLLLSTVCYSTTKPTKNCRKKNLVETTPQKITPKIYGLDKSEMKKTTLTYDEAPLKKLVSYKLQENKFRYPKAPESIESRKHFQEFMMSNYTNERNINRAYLDE